MKMYKKFHPGIVLLKKIKQLNLTISEFSRYLKLPSNEIFSIINKKKGITPKIAIRLGKFFRNEAQTWMRLQSEYEIRRAISLWKSQKQKRIKPIEGKFKI